MAEYIEREARLREIDKAFEKYGQNGDVLKLFSECRASILFAPTPDVVAVVRCKDCKLSSEPTAVSRLDLYCNNYDVRFCEKDQKMVCGTHFCGYGTKMDGKGEGE